MGTWWCGAGCRTADGCWPGGGPPPPPPGGRCGFREGFFSFIQAYSTLEFAACLAPAPRGWGLSGPGFAPITSGGMVAPLSGDTTSSLPGWCSGKPWTEVAENWPRSPPADCCWCWSAVVPWPPDLPPRVPPGPAVTAAGGGGPCSSRACCCSRSTSGWRPRSSAASCPAPPARPARPAAPPVEGSARQAKWSGVIDDVDGEDSLM